MQYPKQQNLSSDSDDRLYQGHSVSFIWHSPESFICRVHTKGRSANVATCSSLNVFTCSIAFLSVVSTAPNIQIKFRCPNQITQSDSLRSDHHCIEFDFIKGPKGHLPSNVWE